MTQKTFAITGDYIELIKLLKAARICFSGGEAKQMVEEEMVQLNGNIELRKRAKIRVGDVVTVNEKNVTITVEAAE
ncbi:MAG: RNA-binding S4 domain-containing protein [Bacteroidia bacterium]|nr:RNA-binding S4 domain-containing protein [Bacteroidia bacterium]